MPHVYYFLYSHTAHLKSGGVYRIGDVGLYIFPSICYTLGYSSLIHNFSYTSE